jgi:predicted patatin/cPLA2 family phospholipase
MHKHLNSWEFRFSNCLHIIKTTEKDSAFYLDLDQVVIGGDSAGAQLTSQYVAMQTNSSLRSEMGFDLLCLINWIASSNWMSGVGYL